MANIYDLDEMRKKDILNSVIKDLIIKEQDDLEKLIIEYNLTHNKEAKMKLDIIYQSSRVGYETIIETTEEVEDKILFGMGFWFTANIYPDRPIIKEFYAKRMLDELYQEKELEIKLHDRFKEKEDLLEIGIKKYIIDLTVQHDDALGGYVEVHPEVLFSVEEKIKRIIDNWDKYKKYDYDEICDILNEFIYFNDKCNYNLYDLLHYLKYKMNINCLDNFNNEIEQYVDEEENSFIGNQDDEDYYNLIFDNLTLDDQLVLNKLEKVIKKYLKTRKVPDSYVESESNNKSLKLRKNIKSDNK